MAKAKKPAAKAEATTTPKKKWKLSRQHKVLVGILFFLFSVALLLSFISYFMYWQQDQSTLRNLSDRSLNMQNWLGSFGAWLGHVFLFQGFGVASFILIRFFFLIGAHLVLDLPVGKLKKTLFWDLYLVLIVSVLCGFFNQYLPELGGVMGYELNDYMQHYVGMTGTLLILVFAVFIFLLLRVKMSPDALKSLFERREKEEEEEEENPSASELAHAAATAAPFSVTDEAQAAPVTTPPAPQNYAVEDDFEDDYIDEEEEEALSKIEMKPVNTAPVPPVPPVSKFEVNKDVKPTIENASAINLNVNKPAPKEPEHEIIETGDENFVIEKIADEDVVEENLAARLVKDFGEFDPTLELSNYQFPPIDLLKDYSSGGITINQHELEENKNRIVDTLRNYKIDIAQIKATVGPTVTLYEIVPEAGIRISKIKSLEDDIALSLAALGIRIIAPIPGKGTIGIEVPNNTPTMVSMKSVIASPKFQTAEMELPIALGKTISNETFVADLAKMPHMLMAGATGQGKSVGLNAVLTSLLYKKHPAEVKFVLVDPKKVELTLFNKIERHYLAKLPDGEDAIITDNTKVINTLNSLCIEMDNRYTLLKDAMVRNIKEYNEKFRQRRLNPENGHRFLPYIVLVVDEFADLIMTAGKEVETPIARLAQLARAIGIHLIIATQRPSVNVITGIIKANFPARIAFRVTSKIDSRTILDSQGADQLIGRGDLLYTQGNDLVRVQCAFVDTPEVEKITEFIGNQKAYPEAYLLPEYVGEESGTNLDIDIGERDSMFREAAEVIVTAQQGSASLLQRKLKLGYNRAGRLIDQLEAAGIVGPFEGSKARSVLITDLASLEQFFRNEENSY
ncbi:cell division protein FtsK [Flavobacterium akiainvivens]|uniref:Cell division protein FtsK n=1 Tax=Flavobacterium akiainvivens TaxID=1202724 RepID=A0A0M9VH09_9FLAO|nr:DNA translocase FtsK [Flavobacterium akiainvivens]KOS04782.1 cell division protein FtsK [Flavobacterium akiainvivens]SFQ66324.1 DNA segregation ATPase FtsK/SpoIIIE, S-DNA-T family [Flavobacterium akiainvivens]